MLVLGTIVVLVPFVTYLLFIVNKNVGQEDNSVLGLFVMYSIAFIAIFSMFGLVIGLSMPLFNPDYQTLLFDKSNEITTQILNSKIFWSVALIVQVIISIYFIFQKNKIKNEK
jgi:formate-dependent nitrite reductase membrane component NrfD